MLNHLRIILYLCLLSASMSAQATGILKGKVTDSAGHNIIVGVTIEISGAELKASTGFDGKYVITDIPEGTYTVTARHPIYKNEKFENINIQAGKTEALNIVMKIGKIEYVHPEAATNYLPGLDKKVYVELDKIKELNPEKYHKILRELKFKRWDLPRFHEFNEQQSKRNQEITELEVLTEVLGAKYEEETAAKKKEIKAELKEKLQRLFELKEKERESEVAELEKKIDELKKSMKTRKANKEKIINRRLEELIGEDEYLEW